jgi:hypothetical protein
MPYNRASDQVLDWQSRRSTADIMFLFDVLDKAWCRGLLGRLSLTEFFVSDILGLVRRLKRI